MVLNWPSPDISTKKPLDHKDFAGQDIIITLPQNIHDPYQVKWFSIWCGDKSCADLVFDSIDKRVNACVKDFKIVLVDQSELDSDDIPAGFVPVTDKSLVTSNKRK